MCYLIAKDRESHGCLAFKTTHGKHLVELKRKLNRAVGYKGVQLVTISRPTAYGEYAPYQFVDTEQEFEKSVKALRPQNSFSKLQKKVIHLITIFKIQSRRALQPAGIFAL